jgi:hypothetical protein
MPYSTGTPPFSYWSLRAISPRSPLHHRSDQSFSLAQTGIHRDHETEENDMITTTLDPMTLKDVTDLENAPYVIEGQGDGAIKIYFESEENKQAYLDTPVHGSDGGSTALNGIFDDMADNPNTGSIN